MKSKPFPFYTELYCFAWSANLVVMILNRNAVTLLLNAFAFSLMTVIIAKRVAKEIREDEDGE